MQILLSILHAVQLISAITMIGLVLIQHGKGADMGASFGSGASGSLFGATGSANFLSRSTAACATLFFACTLALAFVTADRPTVGAAPATILEQAQPAASAASGAAAIPAPAEAASASASAPAEAASGAGAIPTK